MAEGTIWHPLIPTENESRESERRGTANNNSNTNSDDEVSPSLSRLPPPRALAKIPGSEELAARRNLMNAWGHEERAELRGLNWEERERERDRLGEQLLQTLLEDDEETALDLIGQPLVNINHATATGVTPLMLACFKGFDTVVTALLEKGADINAADKDGTTALIRACNASEAKIAMALLNVEGIDVNARSKVFGTALENCDQPAKSWNIRLVASGITMEDVKARLRKLGATGGYRRKRSTRNRHRSRHQQKKRRSSTHKRMSRR